MSFNVLVIPEDPTWNGYILKPVVQKICDAAGKPNANVVILTSPRLSGIEQAVGAVKSEELYLRYKHMDLWLFLPDADRMGAERVQALEEEISRRQRNFICKPAMPEIEIWLLAGHRNELGLAWDQLRAHPTLKETVFVPFLKKFGDPRSAGGGRKELTVATLENYTSLKKYCPEIGDIEASVKLYLDTL